MKKYIFFVFLFVFLLAGAQAKFVCGEVNQSDDGISPSWYEVRVFYYDILGNYSTCEVSPDDNRFCCDVDEIEQRNWAVGNIMTAEILDNSTGYISYPVNVTLTSEGYDLFPSMELEKLINVTIEPSSFIFSEDLNFSFDFLFLQEFSNVDFRFNGVDSNLCTNCNSSSYSSNGTYGTNNFTVKLNYSGKEFSYVKSFSIIPDYNFSRKFVCDGCGEGEVNRGKVVEVSLSLNFSHPVSNLAINEYVPNYWEVTYPNKGSIYSSNENYDYVSWVFTGNSFSKTYKMDSPKGGSDSSFFSIWVEDTLLEESEIILYNYVSPILSNNRKSSIKSGTKNQIENYSFIPEVISKIDSIHPLVTEEGNLRMAIYPTIEVEEGKITLSPFEYTGKIYNRSLIYLESYLIQTNLKEEIFKNSTYEYSFDKNLFGNYIDFRFFGLDKLGNLVPLNSKKVQKTDMTNDYVIYSGEPIKGFIVYGIKEKLTFWDKVVEFYWKIKAWFF